MQVRSVGWEGPLEMGTATYSGIHAWEIYGQRGLVGYSSCGHKELDMILQLNNNKNYITMILSSNLGSLLKLLVLEWMQRERIGSN